MSTDKLKSNDHDNYFKIAKGNFREFYNQNLHDFQAAEKAVRNLICLLLKDQSFPEPKVSSRTKEREECIEKFVQKYREAAEVEQPKYKIESYITDLIGLRIVCYYESDIENISDIISTEFEVLEITDKSLELEKKGSEFGYKGKHLDVKISSNRCEFPEYNKLGDRRFEIQIRTLAQDAWSEVDHKLKYKHDLPAHYQRRIVRLSALFELADQEFQLIRDEGIKLENEAQSQSLTSNGSSKPLDTLGFLTTVNEHFKGFPAHGQALSNLMSEIKLSKNDITALEFKSILDSTIIRVNKYNLALTNDGSPMSPMTSLRHCLYLNDTILFKNLIYNWQKLNFDNWLKTYSNK